MIQLTEPAMELLAKICAAYASQPFAEGKEEQFRPVNLCRAEHRLAMLELRRMGLLAVHRKIWGEKQYYIPAEKLPLVQSCYFPFFPEPGENCEIYTTLEEGSGLAGDFFQSLLFVAQEGLPVTAKGLIHKKHIHRLASKLGLQDKHVRGLALSYPNPEIYPLPAVIMVDLMLSLGLLNRQDFAYTLDVDLQSWLHLPEPAMSAYLYRSVVNRYASSEPACQHFRCLIERPEFVPGEWVSVSAILDWMEDSMLAVPGHRQGLMSSCLAWLECLAGFGWCQVGNDLEGSPYFRWMRQVPQHPLYSRQVERAPESTMLIVQSDFEVLVPPEVPYNVRWTLACCSELVSVDVMWSFRLTQERLELANERGMSPDEVIQWLHKHVTGGLTEPVRLTLEQWGRGIGRTHLSEILLLACSSEEEGDAIASHPRLQEYLHRLGPLHFSVPKEKEGSLRKELAAAGLAPSRQVLGREELKPDTVPAFQHKGEDSPGDYFLPDPRPDQGIIHTGTMLASLQPDTSPPDEVQLPGARDIPSMWSRDMHSYHSSTAQKIMEQAMEWGIKVRISLNNQICEFIPSRVLGNPWRISGHLLRSEGESAEEMELPGGSWKEMQLIFPRPWIIPPSSEAAGYVMISESTDKVEH
jgi:hypothetical protein